MNSFPTMTSVEAFRTWRAAPSRWSPAAMDIARGHGLPHTEPHIFPTGTNLVVALNSGLILKIFPTMFRHQFLAERAALTRLRGRLDIAIPQIVLEGDREQWPYLVMTRLAGTLGTQAWPRLPEDQKEIVLGQIGETIVQVQRAPVGDMAELEPRWPQFMSRQIDACRSRHLRLGLPQKFLMGLDDLLREATTLIPMDAPPILLTGEYIPENFLLESRDGGWRLSGLIDFGDAFTGWSEVRSSWSKRVHDRRKAGSRRELIAGLWVYACRFQSDANPAIIDADVSSPCQRPALPHLHRGLAR